VSPRASVEFLDALYGDLSFPSPLGELASTPAVQRLRDIRLSNIDSLAMPGIANISRYEHALGTAHLASRIGVLRGGTGDAALMLQAAAMLHDAGIAAFGHLVEEALAYAGAAFDHEAKLSLLRANVPTVEVGGLDLQLFARRQAGLRTWAAHAFGPQADERLETILSMLKGLGPLGPCIKGDLDLDNLDNVVRIAFHMGLHVDRNMPLELARHIVSCDSQGIRISTGAVPLIEKWLDLRRLVYTRLMLSREDFVGKVMLISAVVRAYEKGALDLPQYTWTLTDRDLQTRLLSTGDPDVVRTVEAWMVRELWPLSDLLWMAGDVPPLAHVPEFSRVLSGELGRPCFAYVIRDKRTRRLTLRLDSGQSVVLGTEPRAWLLGVGSAKRQEFSVRDNRRLEELASGFFGVSFLGTASDPRSSGAQLSL